MKRILLIADSYFPMRTSMAKMVRDLACEFRRGGRSVTVVAPTAEITQSVEQSVEDGVRVVRVRTKPTKGCSKFLRGVREFRFSSLIWRQARRFFTENQVDLIVYFAPGIFFGPLIRRLKALYGCPAYLVQRDLWTHFMLNVGALRQSPLLKMLQGIERKQYECADIIGVQSRGDLSHVTTALGAGARNVEVLYNWYSDSPSGSVTAHFREQLGLENKVIFFYGGNCGVAQDVISIVRLAASLSDQTHIYFLLVGWGSEVDALQQCIASQGLTNIRLLPTVSQEQYLGLVSECDVGLLTLDRRLRIQNIPGKLMAYLSCSKPVLANVNAGNDLEGILAESGAGYCCTGSREDSLRQYALLLADDVALRRKLGRQARKLLEERFSAQHAVEQILQHFQGAPRGASTPVADEAVATRG